MNSRYLVIIVLMVASVGCVSNTVPANDTYTINIICEADKALDKPVSLAKVLKVSKPKSSAAINSRRILYLQKEFSQNAYAHSSWSDTPNKMLGSLFLSCLNKSSIYDAVLPSSSKGKSDYLLESNIFEFYHHIHKDGSSEGRVRVEFYLIDNKSRKVLATKEFFSKIHAIKHNASGGVKALNDASRSIATNLTLWLSSLSK